MKYSTKPLLLVTFLSVVTSIVAFVVAAQLSPSTAVRFPGHIDPRESGVDFYGWTEKQFSFVDNLIEPSSAKVGFAFETVRPREQGAANVEIIVNGASLGDRLLTRDPFYITPKEGATNIDIKFDVKNPFTAENGNIRGAKLARIKLEPQNLFLLPKFSEFPLTFFSLVLFSIALFISLSTVFEKSKKLTILVPLLASSIGMISFSNVEFYGWSRGYWLFLPITVVLLGAYIGTLVKENNNGERRKKNLSLLSKAALLSIFIFALWIRISGVSFGLPHIYHPDEARKINISRSMILSGSLDPDYFRHPTFLLYATAGLGKIQQLFTNEVPTTSDLAKLGRSVSAVLGALSILVIYIIGKTLYGKTSGFIAALLIALCPMHIVCSRYIKEDVGMLFFSLCALALVLKFIFEKSHWYQLPLAGLIVGFASSVKYTGILSAGFILAPLICVLVSYSYYFLWPVGIIKDARNLERSMPPIPTIIILTVIGLILVPVGFLMISPYTIINTERFLTDFSRESAHMKSGHSGVISAAQYLWSFHLEYSYLKAIGTPLFIIGLLGTGLLLGQGTIAGLVPIIGFILFYLPAEWVNAKPFPQPERYILPTIVYLSFAIGYVFQRLLAVRTILPIRVGVLIFLIFALMIPARLSLIQKSTLMDDTRKEAKNWVMENIPQGSSIISDWYVYGPNIPIDVYKITELKNPESADILRAISVEKLKQTGADYFITSSFFYNRYLYQLPAGNPTGLGYKQLFSTLTPIAEFSAGEAAYGFHNPVIKIYSLR